MDLTNEIHCLNHAAGVVDVVVVCPAWLNSSSDGGDGQKELIKETKACP
jgi:hypothetical protein